MRKILSFLTAILFAGSMMAETYTVDFENEAASYTDWTITQMTTRQTNSNVTAHGGDYFGTTGGKATASMVTASAIANPSSITFYVSKASTNTTASSWLVKVSEDGEEWTTVGDAQSASSGITRGTWYEVTRDLSSYSNVYVGVFYEGTTAVRCIDDLTLVTQDGEIASTGTFYLALSADWAGWPAKYSMYYFKSENDANGFSAFMTAVPDTTNIYTGTIPDGYDKMIFVRHDGEASEPTWENKWSQTVNLDVPTNGDNLFTVVSGGTGNECNGTWSVYGEEPAPYVPTLANGFYLVGTMNEWTPAAEYHFTGNPENNAEFMLTATLAEGDELKVVNVLNDAITAWFPAEGGNYVVDANHAGEKTIYFRPDNQGGEDWFGACIYIAPNAEPQPAAAVVLPATLDVTNVSFRSEGMPDFVIEEGQDYAGTYFDMGAHDSPDDTLLYAEWNVTIQPIKYNIAVDVYNTNSWRVQLYLLSQAGDTLKSLRYKGSSEQKGQYAIGSLDLSDLEAGNYKVRAHAATAWSAMKLKDVIFTADYQGVNVDLPGTLLPAYAELSSGASIANNAIAFAPSTANNEYAIWNVTFAEAGDYNVTIDMTASNGHTYGVALLSADGESQIGAVAEAQAWDTGVKELGAITVPAAGSYKVKLTNATQWSEAVLNSITFAAPAAPALENGFYLIGQNGWDVAALSADLLFAANPDTEGEYKLTTTLAEGQTIKVVKVENDAIVAWYPDGMGNEYTVDAAHAGENKDIYFQETYKEDWAAFGGFFWTGSNEPPVVEKYCEKPSGHLKDPNFGDPSGRILLTIAKGEGNNIVVKIKNNNEAGNPKTGLNYLWVNAEGATGGVVRYGDGTHAEADVEEVSVIVPFEEARESYNFLNIHWAYSGWEGEWAIDGLTVTAAELCEGAAPVEPTLANGFYLIGQNGWDVAALSADLLFAANPDTEGEYKLTTTLAEGQTIKVVKVENDAIVAWYPDGMGNEYTVDAAHAGENKDIYFQETYKEDWAAFGGYFWTGENGGTAISNTAADAGAVKVLNNGMLLIRKGDKTYNVMGQAVK